MKNLMLSLLFVSALQNGHTQECSELGVYRMDFSHNAERSFYLKGADANLFLNYMFDNFYSKSKKRGAKHQFKKVKVEGIESLLNLKVNEGIFMNKGSEEGKCSGWSFNTFLNESYRQERLKNLKENETYCILIRTKSGGQPGITTDAQEKAFLQFVNAVIAT